MQRQQHKFFEVHRVGSSGSQVAEGLLQGFPLHRAVQPLVGVEVRQPVVVQPLDGRLLGRQLLFQAELLSPLQVVHRQHASAEPGFGHGAAGVGGAVVNHHKIQPLSDPEGQVLAQQIASLRQATTAAQRSRGWVGGDGLTRGCPPGTPEFPDP